MRRTLLSLLVVAAGVLTATTWVGAATPAPLEDAATVQAPAVRLELPDRALLISDSAWLGMQFYSGVDQVQGFDHTLSLKSCRRRVSTSCTNYEGTAPITLYEEVAGKAVGYTTLIVATGYNDSDNRFTEDIDDIVMLARSYGYERIVWLTLRSNVTYTSPDNAGYAEVFERSNAALRRLVEADTYPEIMIADWADYSRDRPEWFSSRDGIHLRRLGGYAAGDYISRKMAFLDSRACPQPASSGDEPLDPCPDPDGQGPVIDLETIYPTDGSQGIPFTLYYEGSSSWPNLPWWEL